MNQLVGYLLLDTSKIIFLNKKKEKEKKEKKEKKEVTNTFTNFNISPSINELQNIKYIRFKCLNCNRINYIKKLFCNLDCRYSYKFRKEDEEKKK